MREDGLRRSTFRLATKDGQTLFVHRWLPEASPKAAVQIVHGIVEHAGRYARLADALNCAGYAVYASDHRGHGRTASKPEELGFFAERNGWRKCVDDLWSLNQRIVADYPGLPIVLIGHSVGSLMAQHFISDHGEALAGVVLASSNLTPVGWTRALRAIAAVERLRLGRHGRSELVHTLTFGKLNRQFRPTRTHADWISRDSVEVDKYVADPLCSFRPTLQLWIDLLDAIGEIARLSRQARIPKQLPIYVIAGTGDPFAQGKSLEQLLRAFYAAGLHVTCRFYPEARHELFHETNREEVTRDLVDWLDGVVGHKGSPSRVPPLPGRRRPWA